MPTFKKALSKTYSPEFGRGLDPDSEVSVTTGVTERLLSSITAFAEPGDEVILMGTSLRLVGHEKLKGFII